MLSTEPIAKRGSSSSIAASTPYQPPSTTIWAKLPPRLANRLSRAHILEATCL